MRLYETTFITDLQLDEAQTEQEIKKFEQVIISGGGEIVDLQRWGIKRLAYEIKKKKQGFYTHVLYKGEPGIPAALASAFKVDENVIRFLTVLSNVDLAALEKEAEAIEAVPSATEPEEESATEVQPEKDEQHEEKGDDL